MKRCACGRHGRCSASRLMLALENIDCRGGISGSNEGNGKASGSRERELEQRTAQILSTKRNSYKTLR